MKLFNKNAVGLDIADGSLEVISLGGNLGNIEILGKGRIKLSPGIVERGRIKDPKKLTKALKKVLKDAKPEAIKTKDFFVVLPEAVCFTCVIDLERESSTDIFDIMGEVHNLIPISPNELTISHKINKSGKEYRALVIATENDVLVEWQKFFDDSGFKVNGFDSEPLALYRGLFSERKNSSIVIVDIGAYSTNISIFIDGFLRHSYSINIAGENVSQSLMSAFSVTYDEAEKIKKEKGLSDPSSKESQVITKTLDGVSNSLEETIPYFGNKFNKKFDEVILVGGTSSMPGIEAYFETNLDLKTSIGSSFAFKKIGIDSILYIEAIGLAMRGINDSWEDTDTILEYSDDIKIGKDKSKEIQGEKIKNEKEVIDKNPNNRLQLFNLPTGRLILLIILLVSFLGLVSVFIFKKDNNEKFDAEVILNDLIPIEIEEVIILPDAELIQRVVITDTPTGWLNVREGPGLENVQVFRVNPNEEYELLEEFDGWYKIKINEDTEGWISAQYANIILNEADDKVDVENDEDKKPTE